MVTIVPTSSPTQTPESFAAMFEASLTHQPMRAGEIIIAEVVSVDSDYVIVNAGLKSEGVIATSEFMNSNKETEVKAGDFVKVFY